jgi:hypothetical protein
MTSYKHEAHWLKLLWDRTPKKAIITQQAASKALGNTEITVVGMQDREDGKNEYTPGLTFGWCFKPNGIAHWQ